MQEIPVQTSKHEMIRVLKELRMQCLGQTGLQLNLKPLNEVIGLLQEDVDKGRHPFASVTGVLFSVYSRAVMLKGKK